MILIWHFLAPETAEMMALYHTLALQAQLEVYREARNSPGLTYFYALLKNGSFLGSEKNICTSGHDQHALSSGFASDTQTADRGKSAAQMRMIF